MEIAGRQGVVGGRDPLLKKPELNTNRAATNASMEDGLTVQQFPSLHPQRLRELLRQFPELCSPEMRP